MNVTHVALCPSAGSTQAQRPALTPELLAACGARYSRNNEGLTTILSKIDPHSLEKSVDTIFRMVDYGHQSIADMVPVAIFIDGISIWLAYYLWTLCPTAGGQESSTRYIKLSVDGLIRPDKLGIPESKRAAWLALMDQCFHAYQSALSMWENLANQKPELMGIPHALLEDSSEAALKKVARLKRNFAFDRARSFLPVAAQTNVMMLMSARGWVNLCQNLLSHPLPEANLLGERLKAELTLAAPRMTKYARRTDTVAQMHQYEFGKISERARQEQVLWNGDCPAFPAGVPHIEVMPADSVDRDDLAFHNNRYAPIGSSLQRMAVRFGWSSVSFAEIRDLNRHRTGSKYCPLVPQGFYYAADQMPATTGAAGCAQLEKLAETGKMAVGEATRLLIQGDPSYIYWSVLGTEYPFIHLTTADKFIYEAELRTGLGAHYRYAKHLRDVLTLFYMKYPELKGLILEGSAEPE